MPNRHFLRSDIFTFVMVYSFYFRLFSNELNSKLTYFLKEVMIYVCLKRQRMERRNLLFSMKQCMDSDNLHRRLKKIIGQLQAVDRMIDEEVPCEDILSQMNAAKSAIHKCGQIVLEGHIKHCVKLRSSFAKYSALRFAL